MASYDGLAFNGPAFGGSLSFSCHARLLTSSRDSYGNGLGELSGFEHMISAVISAAAALLGVLIGSSIPVARDLLVERRRRQHLVVRLVCILDTFVADCAGAIGQDTEQADEIPLTAWPTRLEFPSDLEWHLLPPECLYRILSLPNRVIAAAMSVEFIRDVASTERDPQYLGTVDEMYTQLGLEAADLADKLRRKHNLPSLPVQSWDPIEALRKTATRLADRNAGLGTV